MQFDIKKYKEIMEHIDEDEEDDMEIVSFTDRDILNKVNKNGYYTLCLLYTSPSPRDTR